MVTDDAYVPLRASRRLQIPVRSVRYQVHQWGEPSRATAATKANGAA
jgi:hypothetical protein